MPICAWCTASGEAGSMPQLNPRTPVESWRCSRLVSGAEDNTIGRPEALPKKTSSETVPCAEHSTAQSDEPARSRLA